MRRTIWVAACAAGLLMSLPAVSQDRAADWLKKPSPEDFDAAVPSRAASLGISGGAILQCEVNERGLLENCTVVSERPAGMGFGVAALQVAPAFQMKPALKDGRPVRSVVRIPLDFYVPSRSLDVGRSIHMLQSPVWERAPTQADLLAAWPQKAGKEVQSAHVVLRCSFTGEGTLRTCETVSATPRDGGFDRIAIDLAKKSFKARVAPGDEAAMAKAWVTVPVHFVRPGGPDAKAPKLTHPRWIRTLNPQAVEDYYPAAAKAAGVRTGVGTVDCGVVENGMLADCRVVDETPAGQGFGEAALKVAGIMQMNPWTDDGGPVNGARISIPIRLTLPEEAAAPAKP